MSYMNMTSTTGLPSILRQANRWKGSQTSGFRVFNVPDGLGSNNDDAIAMAVEIVNECQRRFFDEFPMILTKSGTVNLEAGNRYSDIPDDLRDTDIFQMFWTDGCDRGKTIPLKTYADMQLICPGYPTSLNVGLLHQQSPDFAVVPWGMTGKIEWFGTPRTDRTATLIYRATESQFTANDVDPEYEPATISDVPDRMIPVLAMMIAIDFSEVTSGVNNNIAIGLRQRLEELLADWRTKIPGFANREINATFDFGGYPSRQQDIQADNLSNHFNNYWSM